MKLLAPITLLVLLSGCSIIDLQSTATVVEATSTIGIIYDKNVPVDIITRADLTEEETEIVINELVKIEENRTFLARYEKAPELLVTEFETVFTRYNSIKTSYKVLRGVVVDNFDEYSKEDQNTFLTFDGYAIDLDMEFSIMYYKFERNEALQVALKIANVAVKTAALL